MTVSVSCRIDAAQKTVKAATQMKLNFQLKSFGAAVQRGDIELRIGSLTIILLWGGNAHYDGLYIEGDGWDWSRRRNGLIEVSDYEVMVATSAA